MNLLTKFDNFWSPCRYGKSILLINWSTKFDHFWSSLNRPSGMVTSFCWSTFWPNSKFDHFWSSCRYGNFICWSTFRQNGTIFEHHACIVSPFLDQLFDQVWPLLITIRYGKFMCWSTVWPNLIKFEPSFRYGKSLSLINCLTKFDHFWTFLQVCYAMLCYAMCYAML